MLSFLLGAGKMGSAHCLTAGWARGLDPRKLTVIEPQPANQRERRCGGAAFFPEIQPGKPTPASAVVIAVKPQSAP